MDAPQNVTCSTISALTSSHKSSQIVVAHIRKRLPYGYTIGDNDVYCGRGVLCSTHVGNHRFRLIVLANLERYCTAQTKSKKTAIIYEVVDHVRSLSPDGVGGFVTKESSMQGFWFEVGDLVARQKTSQAFRDALVGRFKSSHLFNPRKIFINHSPCAISRKIQTYKTVTTTPSACPLPLPHNLQQPQHDIDRVQPVTPNSQFSQTTPLPKGHMCTQREQQSWCTQLDDQQSPLYYPMCGQNTNMIHEVIDSHDDEQKGKEAAEPSPFDMLTFDLLLQFCEGQH